MNYKEILSRITGFSIPVFGVSWDPPEAETAIARKVLVFLEDRRVLYNPFQLETEGHCIQSVIEIRHFLTEVIGNLRPESKLVEHLRGIRAACRQFLDESGPGGSRRVRPYYRGPYETEFFTKLGELRANIGFHIAAVSIMNGLDVEEGLARVLPPVTEERDDDLPI